MSIRDCDWQQVSEFRIAPECRWSRVGNLAARQRLETH
jgi:hypothetical protein